MTNITTLRPGEHFIFKNSEWVCLDPHHPDGGVLAIMAEPWAKDVKFCPDEQYVDEKGNWNNYRTSNVRGILSDMENAVFEKNKACMSYIIDHQEEKKGLYLSLENCEGGAVVVACENSTGFAYIEEFDSVKAAIKWLRREE